MDAMTGDFESERPRLRAVAYSILGSFTDADDAVQNTWLRWQRQDRAAIDDPRAWLTTVVTRIALDDLGSARRRREDYVGPWLPEPQVEALDAPAKAAETADAVEMALLVVLEKLSPAERAAFVLCDVFGYDAAAAANALEKSPAAVRQLASRGRRKVRDDRPPHPVDGHAHRTTVAAFVAACQGRNLPGLLAVLAPDVTFVSDGGGKVPAAGRTLTGRRTVGAALAGFGLTAARKGQRVDIEPVKVNGAAGVIMRAGGVLSVYAVETDGRRVTALRVVRNPDKLTGVYASQRELFGDEI